MGSNSGDRSTQTSTPPAFITQFTDYLNGNVLPMLGTGQLNPRIPDGFQVSAGLDPSVSGANSFIQQYLNSGQYGQANNQMFQNLQNLSTGQTPQNPLSQSGGVNQSTMEQTLYQLMTGQIPGGMNLQGNPNGNGGGNLNFSGGNGGISDSGGGSYSSGIVGGYNPLTSADIQGQIDASNDDAARAMQRGGLRDIRMSSIAEGGLGGSRQGVMEGVAQGELQRGMARNAAEIRAAADNNERNRLAAIAQQGISSGAQLGAAGTNASTQLQLGQMNNALNWGQLLSGNALGAANANQGLMNSGQGYGIDMLRSALGLAPSVMQSPISNQLQGAGLGMQITDFNQSGIDRNLAAYMQNGSTFLNDLQQYAGFMGLGQGFGTQTTQGPSSSRFGNAMGGAASGYAMSGGQGWGSTLGFLAGLFG